MEIFSELQKSFKCATLLHVEFAAKLVDFIPKLIEKLNDFTHDAKFPGEPKQFLQFGGIKKMKIQNP